MGSSELAKSSHPVENFSPEWLNPILADMHDTMNALGGVGIAAPQIGIPYQIILFGFERNERYPEALPIEFTILINPKIEILSDAMIDGWEGCLSVPGLRGLVPRYAKIQYTGYDEKGARIKREAEDFHARVIQHECDHLNGILYPQRIKDLRYFGFEDELANMIWPDSAE